MPTQITDPKLLSQLQAQQGAEEGASTATSTPAPPTAPASPTQANPMPPASMVADPTAVQYLNAQKGAVPGSPAQAPMAKEQSVIPAMKNSFALGEANMLGMPVDAVGNVLKYFHIVPQDTKFFGGSEQFKEAFHARDNFAVPLDSTGHVSTANQYLTTIAEFLGGAAVFGAGEIAAAPKALAEASKLAPAAVDAMGTGLRSVEKALEGKAEKIAPTITEKAATTLSDKVLGKAATVANNIKNLRQTDFTNRLYKAAVIGAGATASGMGSVEMGQLGKEHAKDFGYTPEQGEAVGKFLGSFFGPVALTEAGHYLNKGMQAGVESAGNMATKLGVGRTAQRSLVNGHVLKETQKLFNEDPTSLQNMAMATEVMQKVDGFKPNLPQITGSAGLKAQFRGLADKSPDAHSLATQVDQANQAALAKFKEGAFGPSTAATPSTAAKGKASNIFDPAKLTQSNARQINDLHMKELEQERTALDDAFRTSPNPEEAGAALRELYWNKRQGAKAILDEQLTGKGGVYQTAKQLGVTADMGDVRDLVKKIAADDPNTFQNMPPVFSKVLKEYPETTAATTVRTAVTPQGAAKPLYKSTVVPGEAGKDTASFEELHSLAKQVGRERLDAVTAQDMTKAHYLGQVKDLLEGKVKGFEGPEYGKVGEQLSKYNKDYAQYAHTFREGLGGQLAKRTKNGISTDDSEIVDKLILQSGNKSKGVRDFVELYGDGPEAKELLHNGLLDSYSRYVMKDGVFDAKAAQRWVDGHSKALEQLPETKGYFQNAAKVAKDLNFRQKQLQAERKLIDKGVLAKIANGTNPEKVINSALQDPEVMRVLVQSAKLHKAESPLARAFADHVGEQADPMGYLLEHQNALKPVMETLKPGHWDNLMVIAKGQAVARRATAPKELEIAQEKDPLHKRIGTSVPGMISIVRNPMGVSKWVNAGAIGSRLLYTMRNEDIDRMRKAALFDPDMAGVLAEHLRKNNFVGYGGMVLQGQEAEDLMRLVYIHGINGPVQALHAPLKPQELADWLKMRERQQQGEGAGGR